jgi:hypothetical protein
MLHCNECKAEMHAEDENCATCGKSWTAEAVQLQEMLHEKAFDQAVTFIDENPELVRIEPNEKRLSVPYLILMRGTMDVVYKISEYGGKVAGYFFGQPLIMWAAGSDIQPCEKVAHIALSDMSGVDAPLEINGETTLHAAAGRNQFEIAEVLLKYYANPHARDNRGRTPLHTAVLADNFRMYDFLHKHAVYETEDNDGKTPSALLEEKIGKLIAPEEKRKKRRIGYISDLYELKRAQSHDVTPDDERSKRIDFEWERIRKEIELMEDAGQLPGIGLLDTPRIDIMRRKLQLMRSTAEFRDHILMLEGWVVEDKNKISEYLAGMRLLLSVALMLDEVALAELIVDFFEEEQKMMKLFPWRYGLSESEADEDNG